ncbi:MAG: hypothetical protein ABI475_05255 [Methylophilaceae bacterium]
MIDNNHHAMPNVTPANRMLQNNRLSNNWARSVLVPFSESRLKTSEKHGNQDGLHKMMHAGVRSNIKD